MITVNQIITNIGVSSLTGKAVMEPAEDSPTVTLDVAGTKEKKLSDVED